MNCGKMVKSTYLCDTWTYARKRGGKLVVVDGEKVK